jgi:hypothetical protein
MTKPLAAKARSASKGICLLPLLALRAGSHAAWSTELEATATTFSVR